VHPARLLRSQRIRNHPQNYSGKDLRAGTDVMIPFFYDFRQFSAKKIEFISKTNVMINFLQNLGVRSLSQKTPIFCQMFRRKYFKNYNIGPTKVISF
jgi:hypothetical protein